MIGILDHQSRNWAYLIVSTPSLQLVLADLKFGNLQP